MLGNRLESHALQRVGGSAILVTPRNQGGRAPWSETSDIAIVSNRITGVANGITILGEDEKPTERTKRLWIANNFVEVVRANPSGGRFLELFHAASDVVVVHNTVLNAGTLSMGENSLVRNPTSGGFVFTDNIAQRGAYGFWGPGGEGTLPLTKLFTSWLFTRNVIVGTAGQPYPAGNHFPKDLQSVRFRDESRGDYRLAADSPYKGAGADGTDIGVDVDALERALSAER